MTLLNPEALWWLLLAVPITVFYLRRPSREQHTVGTLWLWERALAQRSRWSRWRRWVSLSAQLLLLGLMVLAMAQPVWTGGRAIVLIIDVSASMQATDAQPHRLAQACGRARQMVDSLADHESMAILTAGSTPRIVCRPTSDRRQLHAGLAQVQGTDGPNGIVEAIHIAQAMPSGHLDRQIIVLTDGTTHGIALETDDDVRWLDCGAPRAENVGITRCEARVDRSSPGRCEVFLAVENFSAQARSGTLVFKMANGQPQRWKLTVKPGESATRIVSVPSSADHSATAAWESDDHLASDNHVVIRLPGGQPAPVRLMSQHDQAVLEHLGHQDRAFRRQLTTGDLVQLPGGQRPNQLETPAGAKYSLTAGQQVFGPVDQVGWWLATPGPLTVGSSLLNRTESRLGKSPEQTPRAADSSPASAAWPPIGPWLLAMAIILALLEWFSFHRQGTSVA